MLDIFFAPIQGYTDDVYRRIHYKHIGGVKNYYTPFVRVEVGAVRSKDQRDIAPENNSGVPVVPQIIFNNRKEFEHLTDRVKSLGYNEIDLNMGCPFPLQARHGRGCGILAHPDIVSEIIEGIKEHNDTTFSVKMRLGWDNPSECEKIIELLNNVQLRHITLHPRTGIQQYKGTVDYNAFERVYRQSRNPIIYNGDIVTLEDIKRIENKYPNIKGIMLGRGLLCAPSLAVEYANDKQWNNSERIALMLKMHDALMAEYSRILKGDTQMLNKMRTFWEYSEQLLGRKPYKKVMKSGNLKNYLAAVSELKFL